MSQLIVKNGIPMIATLSSIQTGNLASMVPSNGRIIVIKEDNTDNNGDDSPKLYNKYIIGDGTTTCANLTIHTFESDPVFSASPAANITSSNISTWNNKQDSLVSGTNIKTVNNNSLLGSGNVQVGDITGVELEDEIEDLESTLLTDALRKSQQSLLPSEKTQVLTNLGISDVATESNLKTVNGASLVGTGNIEIASTNVGNVTIMQGPGDSQTSIMSQKAVSDYARKVTQSDLNGTSDWIKSKLEENGWQFGGYLSSNGTFTANTTQPYVVTDIIPIDYNPQGHQLIFRYCNNKNTSSYINWYTANGRGGYLIGLNTDIEQSTTISSNVSDYSNTTGFKFTINYNEIPNCYIYDNTTKEYVWRGDEYLYNLIKEYDVSISYKVLLDNIISQELGPYEQRTVSQKTITEQFDSHTYIDNRYEFVNGALCTIDLDDYPEFDVREADGISLLLDGDNSVFSYNAPLLAIGNGNTPSSSNLTFMFQRYWGTTYTGFMIGWSSVSAGLGTNFASNKTYNKWAHQVLTFDFNTGESNIYINGELWATATTANFDKAAFRTALRATTKLYVNAPYTNTNPTRLTGMAIFPRAITANEVTTLFGSGADETKGLLLPYLYDSDDMRAHMFTSWNIAQHTVAATVTDNANGGKDLTLKSGYNNVMFGFTGLSSTTSFYHSIEFDMTVSNGSCVFTHVQYNNQTFTNCITITDSNGNVVNNTTLTSGNTYHIRCVPTLPYNPNQYSALTVAFRFSSMEEGTVLWIHEDVVIKQQGAALKFVKSNYRGSYWLQYNGKQLPVAKTASYNSQIACTPHYEPFKSTTVKYVSSTPPQFNGQMAVDSANGKIYAGYLTGSGGTWKQISN